MASYLRMFLSLYDKTYILPHVWLIWLRQNNDNPTESTNFGVRMRLTEDYTINLIVYLCVSINFIETCLNAPVFFGGFLVPIPRI